MWKQNLYNISFSNYYTFHLQVTRGKNHTRSILNASTCRHHQEEPQHTPRHYTTIHQLNLQKNKPVKGEPFVAYTDIDSNNKASRLLSMSKQTADTIVYMMSLLHKQLHPDNDYSEKVESNQPIPHKSILKTLPTSRVGHHQMPNHSVRMNPNKAQTCFYAKDRRGLFTNYQFSSEFNNVYSELKE